MTDDDDDDTMVEAAAAPAAAAKKPAAAKKKGGSAKAKGKGKAKGKKGDDAAASAHPRATNTVRRAKGWGGLAGFGVAAYLSYKAGAPFVIIGARALVAGVACYLVAWAVAVTVWRHLVIAQVYGEVERLRRERSGGEQPPVAG